jgi:hypothetical protein
VQSWARSGRHRAIGRGGEMFPWVSLQTLRSRVSSQIYRAQRTPCEDFLHSWDVFSSNDLEITDSCHPSLRQHIPTVRKQDAEAGVCTLNHATKSESIGV